MTKKLWVAAGILAVGLPALAVLSGFKAVEGFRHHGDHAMMAKFMEWHVNEKLTELKATDAQKQSIQAIETRLFSEFRAVHEDNRGFHESLLKELQQDSVDASKVHALVDARAAALKTFADKVVDGVVEAHGVLTPEQRKQLFQEMHEHFGREHPGHE